MIIIIAWWLSLLLGDHYHCLVIIIIAWWLLSCLYHYLEERSESPGAARWAGRDAPTRTDRRKTGSLRPKTGSSRLHYTPPAEWQSEKKSRADIRKKRKVFIFQNMFYDIFLWLLPQNKCYASPLLLNKRRRLSPLTKNATPHPTRSISYVSSHFLNSPPRLTPLPQLLHLTYLIR